MRLTVRNKLDFPLSNHDGVNSRKNTAEKVDIGSGGEDTRVAGGRLNFASRITAT